jgi:hypothetical protein
MEFNQAALGAVPQLSVLTGICTVDGVSIIIKPAGFTFCESWHYA